MRHLVSTLETAWRAVPRVDGRGEDLLMVRCRPAPSTPDSADFVRTFERFTYDGTHWQRYARQEPGCGENDGAASLPPRTRLP